jgi:transposase
MARPIMQMRLDDDVRAELLRRERGSSTPKRDSLRAAIVLRKADGRKQEDIAAELKVSRVAITKWTNRFAEHGLAGLADQGGRGRKPSLPSETVATIITKVTQPPPGRTRWSVRSMARAAGVSRHAVHQIWRRNELKPHLTRTFKLSNDPHFETKFWDVIGLYLDPPERAIVLCCDEKSQCQALERTQPGLPLGVGHVRTHSHDYIRHGTITLFAALDYLDGKIISRTEDQHTHVDWLRFLKQIDRETPKNLDLHLIADNYCTHKHERVREWLAKHPRFHMHFTPTGSSWLNLVERFFRDLTQDAIREGSFAHVRELTAAIETYLAQRNLAPQPYRWHKDGHAILAKIQRARAAAETAVM